MAYLGRYKMEWDSPNPDGMAYQGRLRKAWGLWQSIIPFHYHSPRMEGHIWGGSELTGEVLFYPGCTYLDARRSGCTANLLFCKTIVSSGNLKWLLDGEIQKPAENGHTSENPRSVVQCQRFNFRTPLNAVAEYKSLRC